jgi:hypothetical protein
MSYAHLSVAHSSEWVQVEEVEAMEKGLMGEAQRFFVLAQTDNLWKEHLQVKPSSYSTKTGFWILSVLAVKAHFVWLVNLVLGLVNGFKSVCLCLGVVTMCYSSTFRIHIKVSLESWLDSFFCCLQTGPPLHLPLSKQSHRITSHCIASHHITFSRQGCGKTGFGRYMD